MFSGVGGFEEGIIDGLQKLNLLPRVSEDKFEPECIGYSEIDKSAIAIYNYHYGEGNENREDREPIRERPRGREDIQPQGDSPNNEGIGNDSRNLHKNYGDATLIVPERLPDFELLVGGFPCFTAETLILSRKGFIPISEIEIGDEVFTHKQRWRRVTEKHITESRPTRKISAQGILPTYTTDEHPFWARKREYARKFTDPEWIKASELKGYHIGRYLPPEKDLEGDEDFWWIVGRYLADGWLVNRKDRGDRGVSRVVISSGIHKADYCKERILRKFSCCEADRNKSCTKFHITNKEFSRFLEKSGRGARNKFLPLEWLCLPKSKATALFEGYMSGDGTTYATYRKASSVSPKLSLGMAILGQRVLGIYPSIGYTFTTPTKLIEGRLINQHPSYTISFYNRNRSSFIENNSGWGLVRKSEPTGKLETVYNIAVEEDNSYLANGAIVHNCQTFSIAGKRAGFEDTRGTLFFDIARVAKSKQPMWMLLENVKGLANHNEGETLEVLLGVLQELGYIVNFELVNSKNFGVPQNRERIYFICRHIKALKETGNTMSVTTPEQIIKEWLFQLVINEQYEVTELQKTASKDWVIGYLLHQEVRKILDNPQKEKELWGDLILVSGSMFQTPLEELYGSLKGWVGGEVGLSPSELTSPVLRGILEAIIDTKNYSYPKMLLAMICSCLLLRENTLVWVEILKELVIIQEGEKYERINYLAEKGLITETDTLHLTEELQSFSKNFFIGHTRSGSGREILPFPDCYRWDLPSYRKEQGEGERLGTCNSGNKSNELAKCLRHGGEDTMTLLAFKSSQSLQAPNKKEIDLTDMPDKPFQLCEARTEEGKLTRKEIRQKEGRDSTRRGKNDKKYVPKTDDIANCLTTGKDEVEKWVVEPLPPGCYAMRGREEGQELEYRGDETNTITSVQKDNYYIEPSTRIRRLTPIEGERLQGFPDNWTKYGLVNGKIKEMSDSARYKAIGNAVTVNVVSAIIQEIFQWEIKYDKEI